MIITIRNQFKQSTFRYIAMLIVVALGAGVITLPSLMDNQSSKTWVAKVNGEKISYKEFSQEIAEQSQFLAQIRAQYGQYADMLLQAMNWPTDPKVLAFDILIKMALLNQIAQLLPVIISPDYITQSINDVQFARQHLQRVLPLFIFNESGSLDFEKLKNFLRYKGLSMRDFERKIEISLAQLHITRFIESSCYVPLFEVERTFISQNLGKRFSYIPFLLSSFLAREKKNLIKEEEIREFYDQENMKNRRYWVPEKRDGIVWKFDAKSYNLLISPEQINEYYENNKVNKYTLDPVKVHIRQITEKQLAGRSDVSLEMVKEEIENNPSSPWAELWQPIEAFARNDKKVPFEKEAFLLQNNGDISSVIETKEGKVIIQLIKRTPRTYKPLTMVKDEIKTLLMEKQFKKEFVKDFKDILTKNDTQAIESFIDQKGGHKKMVFGIEKDATKISQEMFNLKKGSYGFYVEDGIGYALLLTNVIERNLPDFASVKEIVKDDLRQSRAHENMIQAVQEAKEAASHSSFDTIAKKFNTTLHSTDMIQPNDSDKIKDLDTKGLPSRVMLSLDTIGSVFVHHGDEMSFLIKFDEHERYDQKDFIAAQREVKSHLESYQIKNHMESVVASLHRNATIETNELLFVTNEEYSE